MMQKEAKDRIKNTYCGIWKNLKRRELLKIMNRRKIKKDTKLPPKTNGSKFEGKIFKCGFFEGKVWFIW